MHKTLQRSTQIVRYNYTACFVPVCHAHNKISVVLTQDIDTLGVKGEEKEIAKGYARNYLFPKKLAVYSTSESRTEIGGPSVINILHHSHPNLTIARSSREASSSTSIKSSQQENGTRFLKFQKKRNERRQFALINRCNKHSGKAYEAAKNFVRRKGYYSQ
jgi:ribosomal protein L9